MCAGGRLRRKAFGIRSGPIAVLLGREATALDSSVMVNGRLRPRGGACLSPSPICVCRVSASASGVVVPNFVLKCSARNSAFSVQSIKSVSPLLSGYAGWENRPLIFFRYSQTFVVELEKDRELQYADQDCRLALRMVRVHPGSDIFPCFVVLGVVSSGSRPSSVMPLPLHSPPTTMGLMVFFVCGSLGHQMLLFLPLVDLL